MISYNLTEIKLAGLKNLSLFLLKNKYFSKITANKSFRLKE